MGGPGAERTARRPGSRPRDRDRSLCPRRSHRAPQCPARAVRSARRAYKALHLWGCARVDLRMDTEGKVYVIEINVNADLTAYEDFAEAAQAAGLDYGQLLQRILNVGVGYKSLCIEE
ncbi:MAG: hypothetical protein ABIP94_00405 [Planctomycetota bacterium]